MHRLCGLQQLTESFFLIRPSAAASRAHQRDDSSSNARCHDYVYHENGRASALLRHDESEIGDTVQAVDHRCDGCRIHRAVSETDITRGANNGLAELGDAHDDDADDESGSTRSPQSSAITEACSPECAASSADHGERRPVESVPEGGSSGSPTVSGAAGCGGRQREPRTTISGPQLNALLAAFIDTPKPSRQAREQLATRTGLSMRVIQVMQSTGNYGRWHGVYDRSQRASEHLTHDAVGEPFKSALTFFFI